MNSLYLLGGSPRTAKTTIMSALVAEKKVQFIPADAVEHDLRNVLTGEPHQMLRHVEINGRAEHKASITEGGETKPFSIKNY
jgi:predicted kinase